MKSLAFKELLLEESLMDKIQSIYEQELKDRVVFDVPFHVDVEYDIGDLRYNLDTTMYAEGGYPTHYDRDLPPDYSKMCIECVFWFMYSIDVNGNERYYDKEAEHIILKAIKEVTR